MPKFSFTQRLLYIGSVVGLTTALTVQPASAQGVTHIVRGLNAVINPNDAQRFEDQARRNNRPRRSDIGGITAPGSKRPIGTATPAPPVATIATVGSIRATPVLSALTRRSTLNSDGSAVTNSADIGT